MVKPPRPATITLARAVDSYLDGVRAQVDRSILAPTTAANYERDLLDFTRIAGADVLLDEITGQDIDDALLRFQRTPDGRYAAREHAPTKSVRTVNRMRQSLSRFFGAATKDGWVTANPMMWVSPPAKVREPLRTERTALSSPAAAALLGAASTAPKDVRRRDQDLAQRDRVLVALLLLLGPRVSEVCSADLDAFSPAADGGATWRITGKGGKTRSVPVPAALYEDFRAYVTGLRQRLATKAPGGPSGQRAAFLTWRGRRIGPQAVRDALDRVSASVDPMLRRRSTPHALRHTTATLLVASGWDVKVVADLLGHANISTTSAYLDSSTEHLGAAVGDMAARLSDQR